MIREYDIDPVHTVKNQSQNLHTHTHIKEGSWTNTCSRISRNIVRGAVHVGHSKQGHRGFKRDYKRYIRVKLN